MLDEKRKMEEDHQRVLFVLKDIEMKNRELSGERLIQKERVKIVQPDMA